MSTERTIILSTHIVEDISQSCNDLAVMRAGRVIFRGAPSDLIEGARGHVWAITTEKRPDDHLTIVSSLQLQRGTQYRVLGDPNGYVDSIAVEPSLEDGYMWLMQGHSAGAELERA
jgi:ABC-type multidrug transport system ATPase subunit